MEAVRAGLRLPTRPSDGFRTQRGDDTGASGSIPRSMVLSNQKGASHHARSNTLPLGTPDRGLCASSQRRLSNIPRVLKATPDRQLKLAVETSASSAYKTRHQAQPDALFSRIARSGDGIPRAVQKPDTETRVKQAEPCDARTLSGAPFAAKPTSSKPSSADCGTLGIEYDRRLTESPPRLREHEHRIRQSTPIPSIYPELDRYRNHQQPLHLTIPQLSSPPDYSINTPVHQQSSTNGSLLSSSSLSISSRLFDTPGPSIHSRDTTPTSIASQSPGLAASTRGLPLSKHRLPTPSSIRSPASRRRTSSVSSEGVAMGPDPSGLAFVNESLTPLLPNNRASISGQHQDIETARKPEVTLEPPLLSSPSRISNQPIRTTTPQPKRQSLNNLSKPTAASAAKRSSISRPLPISSPKSTRTSQPPQDGAPGQPSQSRSQGPMIPGNPASRPLGTYRRGSEPVVTDSVRIPPRVASNKSLSMDQGSSLKRENLVMKAAGGSKESLATDSSFRSGTPTTDPHSYNSNRFQFFGFRKRSTTSGSEKVPTPTRKGPAAGTGHEGYGKGRTLRRQSASLNGLTTRNPSANSVSSDNSALFDRFLADRINPVVIAGGTVVENQNLAPESLKIETGTRVNNDRPSIESKVDSVISSLSRMETQETGWPTPHPRAPGHDPLPRRPSDSSDIVSKPATVLRRTVQRFKSSSSDNALRLPHIRNKDSLELTRMQSCNASVASEASSMLDSSSARPKKDRAHRKWNLFGRSRNKSTPEIKSEQVPVTIMPAEKKPIAFYAIMDPADEEDEPMDVQIALREAQVYDQPNTSCGGMRSDANDSRPRVLHSSPELMSAAYSRQPGQEVSTRSLAPAATGSSSSRTGRLVRVGRIPPVVSSRAGTRAPPFVFPLPKTHDAAPAGDDHDNSDGRFHFESSTPPTSSPPTTTTLDGSMLSQFSAIDLVNDRSPEVPAMREFLAFSPRKKSDCTTYSSSTDSGQYSFAATAVIPKPDDPYAEDEIWDEYNDLLGYESANNPRSATSALGVPFHLEAYDMALSQNRSARLSTAWPLGHDSSLPILPEGVASLFNDAQADGSASISVPSADAKDECHPSTNPRLSVSASNKTRESGSSTSSEEWTPSAQVNLRVGSMTVSKWLTFSHILFSDIRHELTRETDTFQQPSILVIDGLGNDDWSYYAAESYPDAAVFNLSPREPPADPEGAAATSCLRPPNHHQFQYLSHLDKFPFASCSFNCVVFRFPAAAPETHFHNILLEARRVLKPEGYIEMSILDLDLNTVGHRARKAIRQLKEQIHERSTETNLASTADMIVRLLGKTGFSSIRAARVGIPVASSIARSSVDGAAHPGSRQDNKVKRKKLKVGDQPSLQEMMTRDGPAVDENITNMVARVGRWWYSRCYEDIKHRPTASAPRTSIWNDRALLRECEELGTSLKLMVCCARSPERSKSL